MNELLPTVRRSVRSVLEQAPVYAQASPQQRRDLAQKMVKVAMMGADLVADEQRQTAKVAPPALASAQEFGDAARQAGQTFQDIRNAIDFPTYVQSLITGVFQAITSSNIQQLSAIGDMLDAVARTEDEFTSENIRDGDVIAWAVQKLPFLRAHEGTLAAREGVDLDEKTSEIAAQLRASESEVSGLDPDDLLGTLGPLIRRRIGRERQQMLATMVQMGLQRVVVDEGRLHASMDMRVDTRSALAQERARREELNIDAGASAQFGMGMWGASAHLNVGFSKIESEHTATREEIDTRAGLRSSVDLAFRTDQIPLDRMASPAQRARLDATARVPVTVAEGNASLIPQGAVGSMPMPSMESRFQRDDRDQQAAQRAREQGREDQNRREAQAREDANRREAQAREDRTRREQQAREDQLRHEREAREDRDRPPQQTQPPPPPPQPPPQPPPEPPPQPPPQPPPRSP